MKRYQFLVVLYCCLYSLVGYGQFVFSGHVDREIWDGAVYLSVVEDYRKISGVYPEQILAKTSPDSTGYFAFSGNNLPGDNRIYRIHVDTCSEEDQTSSHFNGHCPNSREIVFIANNNDTLSLPFSFDNEMFCRVVSKNERANAFLKIDSLKNDMRYAFGTYRSEANRRINSKKWFSIFQRYGEQLEEPLAELYGYAFLSDRTNNLHTFYLEDLKTNAYYDDLLERLSATYPNSSYAKQYEAEITSDKYLISAGATNSYPWWMYLLGGIALLSLLGNLYFFGKLKKIRQQLTLPEKSLSLQEQKVLDLILEDKTNKEIASQLFLSVSTIKTHINNLYKKLHVTSREEVKALFTK